MVAGHTAGNHDGKYTGDPRLFPGQVGGERRGQRDGVWRGSVTEQRPGEAEQEADGGAYPAARRRPRPRTCPPRAPEKRRRRPLPTPQPDRLSARSRRSAGPRRRSTSGAAAAERPVGRPTARRPGPGGRPRRRGPGPAASVRPGATSEDTRGSRPRTRSTARARPTSSRSAANWPGSRAGLIYARSPNRSGGISTTRMISGSTCRFGPGSTA